MRCSFIIYCCYADLERAAAKRDGFVSRMFLQLIHVSRLSGTLCSHARSPGLSVCLHSSIHSRVSLFFYSVVGFPDFRSDMSQNRPFVSEVFLRVTVSGTVLIALQSHRWHGPPSLACVMTQEHKLTELCDKEKEVYKTNLVVSPYFMQGNAAELYETLSKLPLPCMLTAALG